MVKTESRFSSSFVRIMKIAFCDFFSRRDGGYSSSPLIGRYCGTTIDEIIRSQSNRLYLRMKTWFSRPLSGFSIQYHGARSGRRDRHLSRATPGCMEVVM